MNFGLHPAGLLHLKQEVMMSDLCVGEVKVYRKICGSSSSLTWIMGSSSGVLWERMTEHCIQQVKGGDTAPLL